MYGPTGHWLNIIRTTQRLERRFTTQVCNALWHCSATAFGNAEPQRRGGNAVLATTRVASGLRQRGVATTCGVERLAEYSWNRTVWNLEFDETIPPVLHAYTNNMGPVINFVEPRNLDEVSNRIPPTSQMWVATARLRKRYNTYAHAQQYMYIYVCMYTYIYI